MERAARRIGLGTVQFGLDYGITNRSGRPSQDQADAICGVAAAAGMDTLDTASLYGDSEAVIGRSAAAAALHVVTKTPKFADLADTGEAVARLRAGLVQSLAQLRRARVDALLFHDADDLLGRQGEALWAEMEAAKARGEAGKIGLSVYNGAQIDAALARFPIEIVQLPFNPLDRRLIGGGQLDRLAEAKVEVHARSLFLQGLLLQPADAIEPRFGALRDAIAELRDWAAQQDLAPLEAILALALSERRIDRFIVGVTTPSELRDIVSAAENGQRAQLKTDFSGSVALDSRHLDPSRWPELGGAPGGL